jgi:hypothetical protein
MTDYAEYLKANPAATVYDLIARALELEMKPAEPAEPAAPAEPADALAQAEAEYENRHSMSLGARAALIVRIGKLRAAEAKGD